MSKKIRVGIMFGGRSAEHEVSLQSAKSIIEAIDRNKYEIVLIGINKQGRWFLNDVSARYLLNADNPKNIKLNKSGRELGIIPGERSGLLVTRSDSASAGKIDVIFPVLHGTYGEDGTMQGMLKLLDVPFVGAGVLGSATGMDKDVTKRLLRDAGLPVGKFLVFTRPLLNSICFKEVSKELGLPLFIKPANLGSSVGISKAKNEKEFDQAVKSAFEYDNKILIEEFIKGREIECAVLGNEDPKASVPGEIIPQHEFYSYEAKYIDEHGARLRIPAELPEAVVGKIRECAVKTFTTLCCEGMARVDFFLKNDRDIYVNEINTIPGFTKISMYPKLWEATGIAYTELIDMLITLAIERFERDRKLKTNV